MGDPQDRFGVPSLKPIMPDTPLAPTAGSAILAARDTCATQTARSEIEGRVTQDTAFPLISRICVYGKPLPDHQSIIGLIVIESMCLSLADRYMRLAPIHPRLQGPGVVAGESGVLT
jgi:hypothetical protein